MNFSERGQILDLQNKRPDKTTLIEQSMQNNHATMTVTTLYCAY